MSKSCCPPSNETEVAPATGCCPPSSPEGSSCCAHQEAKTGACCPPVAANGQCCPPAKPEDSNCSPQQANTGTCCSPASASSPCCPPKVDRERPGYRLEAFVCGWINSPTGEIPRITTGINRRDRFGAWQMRWGIGRERYQVTPGLYAVGDPDEHSPVLVSANYKLSFDALRRELQKIDAWILVIDTKGINVWCAAGKGTFGTEEIVRRVKTVRLNEIVSHRQLILPQLGAPGVAAHMVTKQTGFRVAYGPVRARDLPTFLHSDLQATPEMRRVTFSIRDRLILTPVELVMMNKVSGWILLALFVLGGIGPSILSLSDMWQRGLAAAMVYLAGLVVGAVLTPVLLPWIPGAALAWKGFLTGSVAAVLTCMLFAGQLSLANTLALALALAAVSSYCAMNFTGSTTYTSPSGVEKEMRMAIPLQALAVLGAGIAWFWGNFSAGL